MLLACVCVCHCLCRFESGSETTSAKHKGKLGHPSTTLENPKKHSKTLEHLTETLRTQGTPYGENHRKTPENPTNP